MWPFKKRRKSRDKTAIVGLALGIPSTGLSPEAVECEARKRSSLFVDEALRRYADDGLTYKETILYPEGRLLVGFYLEPPDRATEIGQTLTSLWNEYSGCY